MKCIGAAANNTNKKEPKAPPQAHWCRLTTENLRWYSFFIFGMLDNIYFSKKIYRKSARAGVNASSKIPSSSSGIQP